MDQAIYLQYATHNVCTRRARPSRQFKSLMSGRRTMLSRHRSTAPLDITAEHEIERRKNEPSDHLPMYGVYNG